MSRSPFAQAAAFTLAAIGGVAALRIFSPFGSAPVKISGITKTKFTALRVSKIEVKDGFVRISIAIPRGKSIEIPAMHHVVLGLYIDKEGKETYDSDDGGVLVSHPYTPIEITDEELVFSIKVYPNGRLTPHLASLTVGKIVQAKGPTGRFEYVPGRFKRYLLLSGGSGITPMLSLCAALAKEKEAEKATEVALFHGCSDRVMERETVERRISELVNAKLILSLSQPPAEWEGRKGRLDVGAVRELLGTDGKRDGDMCCICGPLGFVETAKAILTEIGYSKEDWFVC